MRFVLILLLLLPCTTFAQDGPFNYDAFKHIPVLHEGRIKPLDSVARVSLKQIYGDTSLPNEAAIDWLARVVFAPRQAMGERIFALHSTQLAHMLSLPEREDALYNFSEVATVFAGQEKAMKMLLAKDKKSLTENEQALLHLYMSANEFAELMGSFSLLLPFSDNPDLNYLDVLKDKSRIDSALKETVKRKGDKIDSYTPAEQHNASLSYHMHVLETLDSHNDLLRVIPPSWEGSEEWQAPWAVIEKGAGSPATVSLFHDWESLAKAYNTHDAEQWNKLSLELYKSGAHAPSVRPFALSLEVTYNALNLLGKGLMGYGAGALLALLYIIVALRDVKDARKLRVAAFVVVLASTCAHGLAILMRMAILLRPPVSTLYESMIFVSFVSACFGLWLEHRKKGGESLIIGAAIACLLIAAANVFAADSDTLEVLVAVLNTNFWLGTHVVCITTGYATALIAGAIAHIYLLKRALGVSSDVLADLQRRLHSVALVALLFTSIGTMLGGIWADQSWGRFWGWDPKENGALLIVLWLIWALHGRLSGQLRELGFACAMALITVVVALAWVGVNLLSVGLHSYGFTDVAANGLMIFCGAEIVMVSAVTALARWGHYPV